MFGPMKGIPAMAANYLARWALHSSQCDYTIKYRRTTDHGNAVTFDGEEDQADENIVCLVNQVSLQLDPVNPRLLEKGIQQGSGGFHGDAIRQRRLAASFGLRGSQIPQETERLRLLKTEAYSMVREM